MINHQQALEVTNKYSTKRAIKVEELKIAKNDQKSAIFPESTYPFFAIFKYTELCTELTDLNDSHIKLKLYSFNIKNK